MFLRILALAAIWFAASLAWLFLGSTIQFRTTSADSSLRGKVESTWGGGQQQLPPQAAYFTLEPHETVEVIDGKKHVRTEPRKRRNPIPLDASRIQVDLRLEPRQKGLLWYSTFSYTFDAAYTFRNPTNQQQEVTFELTFPSERGIYDDLQILHDGKPLSTLPAAKGIQAELSLAPSVSTTVQVRFRSQGLDQWRYKFGEGVAQVRDFDLKLKTNFAAIDFPENTLSPTTRRRTADGWELAWTYRNLVSGSPIALTMPERIQPGPLAGQISYFAPVSLLFFFFVIFLVTTLRGRHLHPVNYFFLAAAFFAFHLLLAYLADHIDIHTAFLVSSAVSVALVVSYLRIVTGSVFAFREAAAAQFVYLILFSYAFFFQGYTGLAITAGAILTLFVAMQATARVDWDRVFSSPAPPKS